jgi:valyl-tRNA synthetase
MNEDAHGRGGAPEDAATANEIEGLLRAGDRLAGALDALETLIRHAPAGFLLDPGLELPDVPVLPVTGSTGPAPARDREPTGTGRAALPMQETIGIADVPVLPVATPATRRPPDRQPAAAEALRAGIDAVIERATETAVVELRERLRRELRLLVNDWLAGRGDTGGCSNPAAAARPDAPSPAQPDPEDGSAAADPREASMNAPVATPSAAPSVLAGDMPKAYEPAAIEGRWYALWESRGDFTARVGGAPYCIMLPPPNVTGSLHMGHAFQDTLMDALVRWQRMQGRDVLWQCGTDHAGIATQMVVERRLASEGRSREGIGREAFVEAVWDWKAESGDTITRQLRRLGTSMDWSRERFTLDAGLSAAVTEAFVRLYEEGLIYRGKRLVNWDPVLRTAISDLEVIAEEEQGHLWHIQYPLANGNGHVVVATTRPETLLGDAAVAVHPEDERYRALVGSRVVLPLTGRTIPIIADEYVDPAFGSGCVKITPAHDFNDYAVGQRHGLPRINVLTPDARINDNGPAAYRGLDRYEARRLILADLETRGLLLRTEEHRLTVPRGDRSGAVLEPYLTDQWYVSIAPLAAPALAAVQEGRIRFVPENWSKTYYEWMNNIQDWCISRQLWWGHRIPAWYDEHKRVYVGRSEAEVRARHGLGPDVTLRQDEDVLDTWFSSALWPISTLGWPDSTPELARYYPTSVLVTGFDIIFFWVARMVMFGLKFTGDVPFREVYIHGLVRDAEGQKMSKSRGNVLDPLDIIDGIDVDALVAKRTAGLLRPQDAPRIEAATRRQFPDGIPGYGTDALRFTFASLATQGRDVRFDLGRIEGNRNFCNKLWNATRFVQGGLAQATIPLTVDVAAMGLPERWIRSRLARVTQEVDTAFTTYRFDLAAQALYEFTWNEYCDWYLELSKTVLQDPAAAPATRRCTQATLVQVLDSILRLLHPLMPFITEELWQRLKPVSGQGADSIQHAPWPAFPATVVDEEAERRIRWLQDFVLGVRRIRGEMNIPPGKPLGLLFQAGSSEELAWLEELRPWIGNLARLARIGLADDAVPESATAIAGQSTLFIPLADLIDPEAEVRRLTKELDRLAGDRDRTEAKLANPSFVERAPAEVVLRERERLAELHAAIARLSEQRERIARL